MEKQLEKLKKAEVSFAAANISVPITDGRTHSAHRHTLANKTNSVHYGQLLEIPNSPGRAMEFLSRSWSPSASSFLQMFSSRDLQHPTTDRNRIEDHEEQLGVELKNEEKSKTLLTINNSSSRKDLQHPTTDRNRIEDHEEQLGVELKNEEKSKTLLTINNSSSRKMDLNQVKGWLKGKPITGFFRTCKDKRKEEIRFHTANLHAALSLTKLAAAIAGFASSPSDINHKNSTENRALYEGMENVFATAATLMTTVCAEAAESLGADRSQVASAINSGLAIRTPIDMMAVTATAATCLRGAEILKSRMVVDFVPRVQETPRIRSQICIITPSGVKEYKYITMYSKHKCIILCFRKKYFGGTLTTSKEYKVFSIEETTEGKGYFFLNLKTDNGAIKLLFEDEKELKMWISTFSNLLKMHSPSHKLKNRSRPF